MLETIFKYCEGKCTEKEKELLLQWVEETGPNKRIFAEIKNFYAERSYKKAFKITKEEKERTLAVIYDKLGWHRPEKRVSNIGFTKLAISSLVIMLLVGGYFVVREVVYIKKEKEATLFLSENIKSIGAKAKITLSSGEVIDLGKSIKKIKKNNISISDNGSGVVISGTENKSAESNPKLNTVSTEKGGFYSVSLSDGTEVWLNSKSSISFPDKFNKKERHVSLKGEALFNVKHDSEWPFYIDVNGFDVKVMGTEFNIMAYDNEPEFRLSLLTGSVSLKGKDFDKEITLTPNYEVCYNYKTGKTTERKFYPYLYRASVDGYFLFCDETLASVLRKLSRWYNIPVTAPNSYDNRLFNGKISNSQGIMPIMSILKLSYDFRYFMQGDTLVIK